MELDNRDKINKLILSAGGRRWTKAEYDRIYFNDLPKLLKLEIHPKYSTLNGEPIEFKKAEGLIEACGQGKFWYDIKKRKFNSSYLYSRDYNIKQMLIDRANEFLGDNEFTEILSDLDDI